MQQNKIEWVRICSFSFQKVIKYDPHLYTRLSQYSRSKKFFFASSKGVLFIHKKYARRKVGTLQYAREGRTLELCGRRKVSPSSLSVCGCVALFDFLPQNFPPRTRKRYHACLFARVGVPSAFRRLLLFFFVRKVKDLLRIVLL